LNGKGIKGAKPGRRQIAAALNRSTAVLLLLQLMGGMLLAPHRTFFPVYLKDLGLSAVLISSLAALRQGTGLIASLIGGTLSDALGRKWTLLAGQVGFVLGGMAFLTPQGGWIAVLSALSGFGMGLHTLGGQSYLIDAAPPNHLGVLSALYNWGYTLGGALGSPAAGFLLDRWSYQAFGTTLVGFALLTIAANAFILPRTSLRERGRVASWKRLFGYGDIAARPTVVVLVLLRVLPTIFWGMALVLIPLLLSAAGASKTTIALYATISQVVAALAQIATGRAADRRRMLHPAGVRGPTMIVFSTLVIGILGIGIMPNRISGLFVFGTLSTATAWSLSTLLPLWVARVTAPQERGRVLGWIHLWWNAAMMAGSMAGGFLYERGPGLPFLVAGALNLGAIVLATIFFRIADRQA
jgi:MFS family permease